MRHHRTLFVLTIALILGACGGSGGSEPAADPDPTVFSGTYFVHQRSATSGIIESTWGRTTADGLDQVSRRIRTNLNGITTGPDDEAAVGYQEPEAGLLQIDRPAPATGTECEGGITADGDIAALSTMYDGAIPSMRVLLRQAGTFTGSELDGLYHTIMLFDAPGFSQAGGYGLTTFTEGFTGTIDWEPLNGGGTVSGIIPDPWSLVILITEDGTVRMVNPLMGSFDGGLLAGGELCVVGGVYAGEGVAAAAGSLVFLRTTSGATDATLTGTYRAVGIDTWPATGVRRSWNGDFVADGSGDAYFAPRVNAEGVPGVTISTTATYIVSPNGRLTVNRSGATYSGAVSADGRYAMFGGGIVDGSPTAMYFMIRR